MKHLVFHNGALGDFVTILPVLKALRQCDPLESITLLGKSRHGELAQVFRLVDETWDVESAALAPLFNTSVSDAVKSRLHSFDTALVFETGKPSLADIFRNAGIGSVMQQPCFPDQCVPIVDYHLTILGESTPPAEPQLEPDPDILHQTRDLVPYDEPVIIIHPGSGSIRKNWPITRFAQVAQQLQRSGCRIVWLAGPAEGELPALGKILHNLPLPILAHLLCRGALFIGNDSGVAHLANAVGCPAVVLFGPSDPRVWAPRGVKTTIIHHGAACAPCHPGVLPASCDNRCMQSISVEDVSGTCFAILQVA
jgi:ADP-heptose:LPS heptosyltransferase